MIKISDIRENCDCKVEKEGVLSNEQSDTSRTKIKGKKF